MGCIWRKTRCTAHAEGSCSLAALLSLTKERPGCPGSPHQLPAPPKFGLSQFETKVTCKDLSTAAVVSVLYTIFHLVLIPWQGHHAEEKGLSLLHAPGRRHRSWHFSVWLPGCSRHCSFHLGKCWPTALIWLDESSVGKTCPQERLFFPDAPLRWSGSLPAHSCAHPATSRLDLARASLAACFGVAAGARC